LTINIGWDRQFSISPCQSPSLLLCGGSVGSDRLLNFCFPPKPKHYCSNNSFFKKPNVRRQGQLCKQINFDQYLLFDSWSQPSCLFSILLWFLFFKGAFQLRRKWDIYQLDGGFTSCPAFSVKSSNSMFFVFLIWNPHVNIIAWRRKLEQLQTFLSSGNKLLKHPNYQKENKPRMQTTRKEN